MEARRPPGISGGFRPWKKVSDFLQSRADFLSHLRYGRGRSKGTCYAYNSDLGIWGRWLEAGGHDWRACTHVEVERFITWQMRERAVKPHIVARRSSCLSSFYKWALTTDLVTSDPVYLADKAKKPYRLRIWLVPRSGSRPPPARRTCRRTSSAAPLSE